MIIDMQFDVAISGLRTALLEQHDIHRGQHSSGCRSMTLITMFVATS